ncbi:MAG TPA: hypothetical protein VGG39_24955 [Polyangiaceae bacterium]|jgi:hypothetical protein
MNEEAWGRRLDALEESLARITEGCDGWVRGNGEPMPADEAEFAKRMDIFNAAARDLPAVPEGAMEVPLTTRRRLEIAWRAVEPIDPARFPEGEPRRRFVETRAKLLQGIAYAELGLTPAVRG